MVGVRFMAETVKILSPEKKVILAQPIAGCPMAEQMDKELICAVKKEYPDYKVVAYINTTADLKTVCDVCVTSSSAVKIIKNMDAKNILFIPDCNLGHYVSEQVPEKNFKLAGKVRYLNYFVRNIAVRQNTYILFLFKPENFLLNVFNHLTHLFQVLCRPTFLRVYRRYTDIIRDFSHKIKSVTVFLDL